jgi:hypothetical protein
VGLLEIGKVTSADRKAPKLRAFLAAISVCPSITRAAAAAGVHRRLHYRRYKDDPVYAAAFDEAYSQGIAYLEDCCMEHAIEGFEQPVIWQGLMSYERDESGAYRRDAAGRLIPLTIRKHSVELKKFMLKGALPEKYRENHHVEHTGSVNVIERLNAGRQRLAKRKPEKPE